MVDSLLDRKDLAAEEEDYLEVLGDLIEQYESEAHPIAPVSDVEMLRHLIEAKGVSQTEVSKATEIADSTISEVLKGKRAPVRLAADSTRRERTPSSESSELSSIPALTRARRRSFCAATKRCRRRSSSSSR